MTSKLNCKQGDLAIVVKSYQGNEGKIVRCLEFIGDYHWYTGVSPTWRVDGNLNQKAVFARNLVPDFQLKPLRDNEEDDETLTWVGKPEFITEE